MLDELFNNVYWKIIVVTILSLLATFSHEIEALKDGGVCYIILAVLALLVFAREDLGFIVLVAALFVLSYNNVTFKKPTASMQSTTFKA